MINKNLAQLFLCVLCAAATACSTQKKIGRLANEALLKKPEAGTAHVGISIMDVATGQYLYNYQGDKYFIPASNTKLLTCYAAMKYLGDSLVGLRYLEQTPGWVAIAGTGDPTFLHPDFKAQRVFEFLKNKPKVSYVYDNLLTQFTPFGRGWAWDDYQDDYMAERSEFPIYGNCAQFSIQGDSVLVMPSRFYNRNFQGLNIAIRRDGSGLHYKIVRNRDDNIFQGVGLTTSHPVFKQATIPFKTVINDKATFRSLLEDTLGRRIPSAMTADSRQIMPQVIHSQPTDSLLKITMHRSDNFFAEQSLLMVSNERLGIMSDTKIIDTLLKTDYAGMPQTPKWVDGSGLSRYNLITPQDFVWLLNKMKQDFSWERITGILQTGGQGTLSSYYKKYAGRIYAKTGTLSNNVSLSGYIITNKGKTLTFSVMVNNHNAAVSNIRREVETFLGGLIEKY